MKLLRSAISVATAGLVVLALPGRAQAHAVYERSDPDNKSTVASPPSSIWAEFSETPTEDSRMDVIDPCGNEVDLNNWTYSVVPGENRITVSVDADKAGKYAVNWRVVSAQDAHPTSGTFTFTSTGGKTCPGADPEPTPPPETTAAPETTAPKPEPTDPGESPQPGRTRLPTPASTAVDEPTVQPVSASSGPGEATAPPVAQATSPPTGPAEGDIPTDGLLIALAIAAVIGAAGGAIYAGIMGPYRR